MCLHLFSDLLGLIRDITGQSWKEFIRQAKASGDSVLIGKKASVDAIACAASTTFSDEELDIIADEVLKHAPRNLSSRCIVRLIEMVSAAAAQGKALLLYP